MMLRIGSEAYSLRYIALANPVGIAIRAAPIVTISVPHTRGNTPNDEGSNRGVQVVPKKNSRGDTLSKKFRVSLSSKITIAAVVTMEMKEQEASQLLMANSPQSTPDFLIDLAARGSAG